MRVTRRIAVRVSPAQRDELAALGVELLPEVSMPGGGDPFVAFDVSEDHPGWSRIRESLQRWGVPDGIVTTEFSDEEIASARHLRLQPEWHHGYPEPHSDQFGYREATYDTSDWCQLCGVGLRQRAPFQLRGEPKWGRRSVLQLNWVFDEFFTTPELWEKSLRPLGVDSRPVHDKRGNALRTVVQLVVHERVEVATEGAPFADCDACKRRKFLPWVRGPFPAISTPSDVHIASTSVSFGSGASAHREVIVGAELATALRREKVRGISLWPVQSG